MNNPIKKWLQDFATSAQYSIVGLCLFPSGVGWRSYGDI